MGSKRLNAGDNSSCKKSFEGKERNENDSGNWLNRKPVNLNTRENSKDFKEKERKEKERQLLVSERERLNARDNSSCKKSLQEKKRNENDSDCWLNRKPVNYDKQRNDV